MIISYKYSWSQYPITVLSFPHCYFCHLISMTLVLDEKISSCICFCLESSSQGRNTANAGSTEEDIEYSNHQAIRLQKINRRKIKKKKIPTIQIGWVARKLGWISQIQKTLLIFYFGDGFCNLLNVVFYQLIIVRKI